MGSDVILNASEKIVFLEYRCRESFHGIIDLVENQCNLSSGHLFSFLLSVVMYCFNLDVPTSLKRKAENAEVELLPFRVIYRLVEDLKKRLSDYLPEEIEYEQAAEGHVIKVFSVTVDRKKQSVGGVLVDWGAVEK